MMNSDNARCEYEQVNQNIRALAEIRFKLLALVPSIGGVAAYLLASLASAATDQPLVFAISLLGFSVTLGITFYDLRNSELYNSLFGRAKFLEGKLELPHDDKLGTVGQIHDRPDRRRRLLFIRAGHDSGLALIYAPVLGAWFFPLVVSGVSLFGCSCPKPHHAGLLATAIATIVFLEEFLRIGGTWKRLRKKLFNRTEASAC